MSTQTTKAAASYFPILSILTIIFVVAKLFNLITWSWWLVMLPFYGPLALCLLVMLVCFLFMGVITYFERK